MRTNGLHFSIKTTSEGLLVSLKPSLLFILLLFCSSNGYICEMRLCIRYLHSPYNIYILSHFSRLPLKSTRYCTKPTKQTLYWTFTNQWILLSKQTLPKVGTQLRVGRLSSIYKFILYHKYYLCPFCPDRIDISPWNCLPHKLIFMHNVKKCM